MSYIGKVFNLEMTPEEQEEYQQAAKWCNDTQLATIVDTPIGYTVIAIPEPTEEELKTQQIQEIKNRIEQLEKSGFITEIALGLASTNDYTAEIEEIAYLHNELYILEEN